jgi:hypothetical protein
MPGKGNARKVGRDVKKCQRYKAEGRKNKNKEKRIAKERRRQEQFLVRKEAKMLSYLRLKEEGKLKEIINNTPVAE